MSCVFDFLKYSIKNKKKSKANIINKFVNFKTSKYIYLNYLLAINKYKAIDNSNYISFCKRIIIPLFIVNKLPDKIIIY